MDEVTKRGKRRVIIGEKAKCIDGVWTYGEDALPMPKQPVLITKILRVVQCWKDGAYLETYFEDEGPLPDLGELNDQVPQAEWEIAYNKPNPPWALFHVVYMVEPVTGEFFTFSNSSTGAKIGYEKLADKFDMMSRLRGPNIRPLVNLTSRKWRIVALDLIKIRPEYTILEWRDLGTDPQPAQLPAPADKDPTGAAVKLPRETTTNEPPPREKDSSSQSPAAAAIARPPAEKKTKVTIGRPVPPITREEEFNDKIPDDFV